MKDTIERQAAIDALDKRFESFIKRFGYESYEKADEKTKLVCDGISEAMDAIMDFPSVQPTFDARDTQYNLPIGTDSISRAEAIDVVSKWFKKIGLNGDICLDGLRQLPSVQPEPKRAKWIATTALQEGQITWRDYKCSNCSHHRGKPMNFCEVCGAKMER